MESSAVRSLAGSPSKGSLASSQSCRTPVKKRSAAGNGVSKPTGVDKKAVPWWKESDQNKTKRMAAPMKPSWEMDEYKRTFWNKLAERLQSGGFILVLQKAPPPDANVRIPPCPHRYCVTIREQTPPSPYRVVIEPCAHKESFYDRPPFKPAAVQGRQSQTWKQAEEIDWLCLLCFEDIVNFSVLQGEAHRNLPYLFDYYDNPPDHFLPVKCMFDYIVPETRGQEGEYWVLTFAQRAAFWKWQVTCFRDAIFDEDGVQHYVASHGGSLMTEEQRNAIVDMFLPDHQIPAVFPRHFTRGVTYRGRVVELTEWDVRFRGISAVMKLIDDRVDETLRQMGYVGVYPTYRPRSPKLKITFKSAKKSDEDEANAEEANVEEGSNEEESNEEESSEEDSSEEDSGGEESGEEDDVEETNEEGSDDDEESVSTGYPDSVD